MPTLRVVTSPPEAPSLRVPVAAAPILNQSQAIPFAAMIPVQQAHPYLLPNSMMGACAAVPLNAPAAVLTAQSAIMTGQAGTMPQATPFLPSCGPQVTVPIYTTTTPPAVDAAAGTNNRAPAIATPSPTMRSRTPPGSSESKKDVLAAAPAKEEANKQAKKLSIAAEAAAIVEANKQAKKLSIAAEAAAIVKALPHIAAEAAAVVGARETSLRGTTVRSGDGSGLGASLSKPLDVCQGGAASAAVLHGRMVGAQQLAVAARPSPKQPFPDAVINAQAQAVINGSDDSGAPPSSAVPLSDPMDTQYLSPLLCLIRPQVEIFPATQADADARNRQGGYKHPITPGRVGIRCKWCNNIPHEDREPGATYYPNSIRLIHQSVRNFQRYHFMDCKMVPKEVKDEARKLGSTRTHSKNAALRHWQDSCARKGLYDVGEIGEDKMIRMRGWEERQAREYYYVTNVQKRQERQETKRRLEEEAAAKIQRMVEREMKEQPSPSSPAPVVPPVLGKAQAPPLVDVDGGDSKNNTSVATNPATRNPSIVSLESRNDENRPVSGQARSEDAAAAAAMLMMSGDDAAELRAAKRRRVETATSTAPVVPPRAQGQGLLRDGLMDATHMWSVHQPSPYFAAAQLNSTAAAAKCRPPQISDEDIVKARFRAWRAVQTAKLQCQALMMLDNAKQQGWQ